MNNTRLIYAVFSVIVGVLLFGIWSNTQVYAQQPSTTPPAAATNSPSTTTISPELKAKMCDPSNPSLKVVNTTESHICGIPKTVKNTTTTAATPPPTAVSSPSTQTTKSTPAAASVGAVLKHQQQQITTASNNNNTITPAASQLPKHTEAGKETTAIVAPVRNISNRSLSSSSSTIAPQVNAITKQQQQLLLTVSNVTAGQNHTFAATSPAVTPGKLMYLGYQGSTTASDSSSSKDKDSSDTKPSHSDSSSSKDKHTSHIKLSSHNDDGSKSSSIIENDISSVIVKSFNFKHSRHSDSSDNGRDSFFGDDSFFNSNHHTTAGSSNSSAATANSGDDGGGHKHKNSAAASASSSAVVGGGSAASSSASASS
jgi:hypothetical protein